MTETKEKMEGLQVGESISEGSKAPPIVMVTEGSATFAQLFSTADSLDYVLMIIGTMGACVTGGCFQFINVQMLLNSF